MTCTLAHLSDPHLAPLPQAHWSELLNKRVTGYLNWQRNRRFIHDPAVLAKIVADLKAQAPDHTACTGDLANIALPDEFVRGRDWLESLGPPSAVSLVPGNHDAYVRDGLAYAARQWGAYMRGDDGKAGFPYLRRRGPLALIGLSSAVPTAWGLATGWGGATPPASAASRHKLLLDADVLKRVIADHGAELLLHGHDHLHMLNWLAGPDGTRGPAVGVPSASAAPGMSRHAAGYNLYRVDGRPGAWSCEMIARGIDAAGAVVEQQRMMLT